MEVFKIGILGCGVISNTYIRDIKRLYTGEMEISAVADVDKRRAEACSAKYDIPKAYNKEEILADGDIGLIVNLTPPKVHAELNREILAAGHNVYCEKPFALTLEDAKSVVRLAEKRGLQVGSAPDTFLGSSLMTCRKIVRDGWIGKPLYVNANMMNSGVETWHPEPYAFYQAGGGPLYDMGGYYFTAIVSMFGPVKSVYAVAGQGHRERTIYSKPHFMEKIQVEVPTFYAVILKLKNGMTVTMNFSFDIWKSTLPMFEVYGTDGTLMVPDPNFESGVPMIYRKEQILAKCFEGVDTGEGKAFRLPELYQDVGEYIRGPGVIDMVRAIREGRECTANGRFAIHVVDIMTGIMKSAETGVPYELITTYDEPGEA